MEDTENVFSGEYLGVDTLLLHTTTTNNGFSPSSSSRTLSYNDIPPQDKQPTPKKLERTPEEDAFLDRAISDDDNFVFDGLSNNFRQQL
jgi:hypothetical protein